MGQDVDGGAAEWDGTGVGQDGASGAVVLGWGCGAGKGWEWDGRAVGQEGQGQMAEPGGRGARGIAEQSRGAARHR